MSRFFVGQRVRVVRVLKECNQHMVGMEAVIVGFDWLLDGRLGLYLDIHHAASAGWIMDAENVEPILYDGNQLVEWSECLWQPEGQAA